MFNQNMLYNVTMQNLQVPANSHIFNQIHNNVNPTLNPSINNPLSEPPKKERLRLKMTQEEKGYFQNLYSIADKKNEGRLYGKDAADFLKKSGLPKDILKNIWVMSAQTDPQFLERDEFYLALRLIALAQNKLEVSDESIRLNHPIPPLPKIDLKSPNPPNSNQGQSISMDQSFSTSYSQQTNNSILIAPDKDDFSVSEEDDNKYTILFNKNKDLSEKISFNKINEMFVAAKIPSETLKKIFDIVPLTEPKSLTINEFKVVFHLIYKSYVLKDVPNVLPNSLKYILSIANKNKSNEIDFSLNARPINMIPADHSVRINQNMHMTKEGLAEKNPAEMESVLLKEFNLQSETASNVNNSIYENPINNQNNLQTQIKNNMTNTNYSNFNQKDLQIIKTNLTNSLNNHIQETDFLQNILESDKQFLNSLLDDVEKINKQIITVTEKNKFLREEILDYRRKINMERDNLIKATNKLYGQTNEIIKTKDELQNVKEEYNKIVLENNNKSIQNQSQSYQISNNPYIPNNSWVNPMSYSHDNLTNNPLNSNQNINYNYCQSQNQHTYIPTNPEIAIHQSEEKNLHSLTNNHSKNDSMIKEPMMPIQYNNNVAPNDTYSNNFANRAFSPSINNVSKLSNEAPKMIINNVFSDVDYPNSNISSKTLGELKTNDNADFTVPITNPVSVSTINLMAKESTNPNITTRKEEVMPPENHINVGDNTHIKEGYPTLESDFKFDQNIGNIHLIQEPQVSNVNNPNLNNNAIKNTSSNLTNFNNMNNVNKNINQSLVNNQFDLNTNNDPSKRESDFDFDFNGYDKVDSFKEIANKKGEDLFKNANNNFEGDWDF